MDLVPDRPPSLVVAGASGSGKTTVARRVAEQLERPFVDADDLHSAANVAKMRRGTALTDEDRLPWLERLATHLQRGGPSVVACSALRKRYRDILRRDAPVVFCMLEVSREIAELRIAHRQGHYMPVTLIDSQFATLEPLDADEPGFTVDADAPVEEVVAAVLLGLAPRRGAPCPGH